LVREVRAWDLDRKRPIVASLTEGREEKLTVASRMQSKEKA
jgi:hypothetical protein